jgi:hypothetical protein
MKDRLLLIFFLTVFFFLFLEKEGKGQFIQLSVDHSLKKSSLYHENLKIQAGPLLLPFWEDFSHEKMDTLKWETRGAGVSKTLGIDPPSQGVAYLDGVDRSGKPYSTSMLENGDGDFLASRVMDLSAYNSTDSVYLSFFWQAGGKGEMPDVADRLELNFLDTAGVWVSVWEMYGGDLDTSGEFTQEMIPVKSEFFHANFRFRFINTGRISGPFDTWVLDYIYLDQNRTIHDIFHEDRALTKSPNSPFGKYSAMPLFEFNRGKESFLTSITSQFKNLSNRFRAMEYSIELRDKETQELLKGIHAQTPFNPVPQALERRDFSSVNLKDLDYDLAEELDLETVVYLTTGDGFLVGEISGGDTSFIPQVDYRINDTLRHTMPVRDYFAYDNGSVDYSAGINQRSGMLALRYELEAPAYLSGISINFTNFAQVGSSVELMVWEDLEEDPIYKGEVIIPEKENLEDFAYFPMDTNLTLVDTFYIGFTQFTNDFVQVGLDKSNDSGSEVFFNVTGSWEQNQEVFGSLMMRPHLSLSPVVTETETGDTTEIIAYPNPVSEILYLEGQIGEVEVLDSYGRQINLRIDHYEKGKIINFANNDKGVYVVRAMVGKKPQSIRILVK